ncbi:UNVERIFIED_CONTAM: hypothetical protein KB574_09355 [Streptococcus canis]
MIKKMTETIGLFVLVFFVPLILTLLFVCFLQFPDLLFSSFGLGNGDKWFSITMIRFWKIYGIFLCLWGAFLAFVYSGED